MESWEFHGSLRDLILELNEIEELRAVHPDREIKVEMAVEKPLFCDSARVAQLLSNLVGNAVQHGTPSGTICVSAQGSEQHVRIEVHNEGRKIDPARLEDIFEPLHRAPSEPPRAPGSLGLGLYIASQIAEAHGGRLEVHSDEAATRFTFLMPLGGGPEAA